MAFHDAERGLSYDVYRYKFANETEERTVRVYSWPNVKALKHRIKTALKLEECDVSISLHGESLADEVELEKVCGYGRSCVFVARRVPPSYQ